MPFTFSHPAIVLPLKSILGHRVSLTGLIIGSLTPDFEYFLRMRIHSEYSHTLLGTLWFNLPLGIALCFIFHCIIKHPLIDNSPKFIQSRAAELKEASWPFYFKQYWLIVCVSILIGAYSHILWDSFTHPHAFFSDYLGLQRPLLGTNIPISKVLQHFSTVIGALVISLYFFSIKPVSTVYVKPKKSFWIQVAVLALIIMSLRVVNGLQWFEYGNIIVSGIMAVMLSLTAVSLWIQIRRL